MSVFVKMLAEKVQSYIELRRSLGYAFKKQAGTLQAFVRHVESSSWAVRSPKAWRSTSSYRLRALPTAEPPVMECSAALANISPSTTRAPKCLIVAPFPDPEPFHRRAS